MAPTDHPADGQRNGQGDRREAELAANEARTELRRVATQLESAATERIAILEGLLDQAAIQGRALGERLIGLDAREREFTRRLRDGLQEVDTKISERLDEIRRLHDERGNALDQAATERVAELVRRIDQQQQSFAVAIKQRERQFDGALQQQRTAIEREMEQRSADLERLAKEQVDVIQYAAADKSAEIHWLSAERREAIDQAAAARAAELEEMARAAMAKAVTGTRGHVDWRVDAAAFEELTDKTFVELEDALRRQFELSHGELAAEARRVLSDAGWQASRLESVVARSAEQLEEMAAAEADRLEQQAEATSDDVRRFAVDEAGAFRDLATERVAELRHILTKHAQLLAELTRLHQSTSTQILEARGLIDELSDRVSELDAAGTRNVRAIEARGAAAEQVLKHASTTEAQRLDQHLTAFEQLANQRLQELQQLNEEIAGLEGSAQERLHELERRVQMRRAEIESLADQRIVALGEQVDRAEAAAKEVAHRTSELAGRAKDTARWLDAHPSRVEQMAADRGKQLEDALAASASRYEARLSAIAEEQTRAVEEAATATRNELREVQSARLAWGPERNQEFEQALAATASRYEARLREIAEEQTRAVQAAAAATRNELRETQSARIASGPDDRNREFAEALAASASHYEARLRAIAEEQARDLEARAAASKSELDGRPGRAGQTVGHQSKELEEALAAAVSGHEAHLRAIAEEERRALEYAATITRQQLHDRQSEGMAWTDDERGHEIEDVLAASASQYEERLRAVADEERRSLEAAGSVTKDDLLHALRRAEDDLEQAVKAQETELGQMIAAARATLEQLSSSHIDQLDMTAGALRIGIEELQRDIEAALKKSGDLQADELNRAAAAWLRKINKVGKKRGRSGLRRTGPSATAVMLAIAAAFGGTMLFRGGGGGGGGGSSNVAAATTESTGAASPVAPSPTVTPPDAGANQDPSAIHWTAPQSGSQRALGSSPAGGAPSGPAAGSTAPAEPGSPPPDSPTPESPPPSSSPPPSDGGPLDGLPPVLAPGTTLPSP
jgi:hypothetical protein